MMEAIDQIAHLKKIMSTFMRDAVTLKAADLAALLEGAFWASLRHDEGRQTRFHINISGATSRSDSLTFAEPVSYTPTNIARLAPAAPPSGSLLVERLLEDWRIVGFARTRAQFSFAALTLEATDPGVLRFGLGPYNPFAIVSGGSSAVVRATGSDLAIYLQRVLGKFLPAPDIIETQAVFRESIALSELAKAILGYGHGGTILVVPDSNGSWVDSISSFGFRFAAEDSSIRDEIRKELDDMQQHSKLLQRLSQPDMPEEARQLLFSMPNVDHWGGIMSHVRATAALSKIDGAIVLTKDLRVLGFGAKIGSAKTPKQVALYSQSEGGHGRLVALEEVGGTRHQSAIRFVEAHHDAIAIVISQDRHMSIALWVEENGMASLIRDAHWWG